MKEGLLGGTLRVSPRSESKEARTVQGGGDGLEARGDGAAGEPCEVVRGR
jgi:hypothetical protein